jgi:lysophospholipase L1-like esterase
MGHNPRAMSAPSTFPWRTAQTLAWFCVVAGVVYLAPRYLGALMGDDAEVPSVASLAQAVLAAPEDPPPRALPSVLASTGGAAPQVASGALSAGAEQALEDPGGTLVHFYEALARTEQARRERLRGPDTVTRIVHYGDSMLTGDSVSGTVRRLLQERFGNGGHGFVLPGKPWSWYRHRGVDAWASDGFRVNRITLNPVSDGCLGLGAVVFRTFQGGARFAVWPEDGERVSRFDLYYEEHPRGGDLTVRIDEAQEERISTAANRQASAFRAFNVPEGEHRLSVTYAGGGEVRIFGVTLERDGPGLVYDSLGVNGLHSSNFKRFDPAHIAEQMEHRSPDLIVTMLGTNESQNQSLDLERHGRDYADMIALLRRGAPTASCLVASPPDRVLGPRGQRRSLMAAIVDRQREVARESGCAFWNTFEAMGGEGSATIWRRMSPPLMGGDNTHPTPAGAELLGAQIARALISGYEWWREAHASGDRRDGAGAEESSAPR